MPMQQVLHATLGCDRTSLPNFTRGSRHPWLFPAITLLTLGMNFGLKAQAQEGELAFASQSFGTPDRPAPPQSQTTDLDFSFPTFPVAQTRVAIATVQPVTPPAAVVAQGRPEELFAGGTHSLVAKAVGSAEGTRTPDGNKTPAYYGHIDPGNRAWNLGSFSYQHGAESPEEADRKQLARLEAQAAMLRQQAQEQGLKLSLEEELNGIDLANQAPQAALEPGGYIDRLVQARQLGMQGSEAVTWARTHAFVDPATGRLNAPGLGNRLDWVFQDQERRRAAVERAIALHQSPIVADNTEALIHLDRSQRMTGLTPPIDKQPAGTTTSQNRTQP